MEKMIFLLIIYCSGGFGCAQESWQGGWARQYEESVNYLRLNCQSVRILNWRIPACFFGDSGDPSLQPCFENIHTPEGTSQLGTCGTHHLLAAHVANSFGWVFSRFLVTAAWWFQVLVWLGIFLTLQRNILGKTKMFHTDAHSIPQHPADLRGEFARASTPLAWPIFLPFSPGKKMWKFRLDRKSHTDFLCVSFIWLLNTRKFKHIKRTARRKAPEKRLQL